MFEVALYGYGHNCAATLIQDKKILETVELERLFSIKNAGLDAYHTSTSHTCNHNLTHDLLSFYINQEYGVKEIDNLIVDDKLHHKIKYKSRKTAPSHHKNHAYGTFYQSPFNEAIIISIDGGSEDGTFCIFHAVRDKPLKLLFTDSDVNKCELSFGNKYSIIGHFLKDIKREQYFKNGNLIYPGKIMGLTAYGSVIPEWVDEFKNFFLTKTKKTYSSHVPFYSYLKMNETRIGGQAAYDYAATLQRGFEVSVIDIIDPFLVNNKLPICLTGGCALNIILNSKIKQRYQREVFVSPVSSDCGQSIGIALAHLKPKEIYDATYSGIKLLDRAMLPYYTRHKNYHASLINPHDIARLIQKELIIGVARGRAEVGPRALGNRSVICSAQTKAMKDKINAKVKHREWFRPFAPIVRLEDVSKYFEWQGESRWMNFSVNVKKEYIEKLGAVTHVDGTARVQTVTRIQNEFIYDILTELDKLTGIGVILNTSFNVDGMPILSSVKEVFTVLEETELDGAVVEDFLFLKSSK